MTCPDWCCGVTMYGIKIVIAAESKYIKMTESTKGQQHNGLWYSRERHGCFLHLYFRGKSTKVQRYKNPGRMGTQGRPFTRRKGEATGDMPSINVLPAVRSGLALLGNNHN